MNICDGAGCKFVEVSSHTGARPSHADWQGKIYSLNGEVTIDGETYPDFYEATGYEGKTGTHASLADRLGGVNCRHSFAPWVPGMGHAYSETPDEDAGWDREEVYKDTQQQRALEAEIRKNKRIAANENATDLEKAEAKAKIWNDQKKLRELTSSKPWLRRDASREKAPELGAQPRGAKIAAKVSSGKSTFESFYEPEDLWLSVNGKEIWHGTGDVNGVTFPDESELKGYRYPEISGVHTHTTPVGGTFSSEDVKALTGLNMKGLEARETLNKQRVYSLSRVAPQSNNTRNQFYEKMHEYETARFQALSEKYYDKYCAPFGVPLTQQDYVKIDKQLKRDLHQWLKRNAIKYGYKYEQQK